MTYHIPICPVCRENEVGAYCGSDKYCSWTCEGIGHLALDVNRFNNYQPSNDEHYERQYDLFITENT